MEIKIKINLGLIFIIYGIIMTYGITVYDVRVSNYVNIFDEWFIISGALLNTIGAICYGIYRIIDEEW